MTICYAFSFELPLIFIFFIFLVQLCRLGLADGFGKFQSIMNNIRIFYVEVNVLCAENDEERQ